MKRKSLLLLAFFVFTGLGVFAAFPIHVTPTVTGKSNTTNGVNGVQSINGNNSVTAENTSKVITEKANANSTARGKQGGGKSQLVALILCFFVGALGIHRFYLGYTWQGIVQLLTLGGCGIWTLIDFIRIITGDLQPKDGSYSKTL